VYIYVFDVNVQAKHYLQQNVEVTARLQKSIRDQLHELEVSHVIGKAIRCIADSIINRCYLPSPYPSLLLCVCRTLS